MERREKILSAKLALLRATVIFLSLALVLSGVVHVGGTHAGERNALSLAVTASHVAVPAHSPCDGSASHGVNDACCQAAGCVFSIPAQAGIVYAPLQHRETVQTIAEVHRGTPAAPPVRPPKLSV